MAKATSEGGTRIGSGTTVRARISGSEDLAIAGRLEGSVELAGTLVVENGGVVKADIAAERVKVAGIVVGDIAASEWIQIAPEGRVLGDLRAPRIGIFEGARFSGTIEMAPVELRIADDAPTQVPMRARPTELEPLRERRDPEPPPPPPFASEPPPPNPPVAATAPFTPMAAVAPMAAAAPATVPGFAGGVPVSVRIQPTHDGDARRRKRIVVKKR